MSKAEEFIQEYTRNCCNYMGVINNKTYEGYCIPWLTPDQALRAVEIAREEIYEWLIEKLPIYIDYRCRGVGESVEDFVNDLKTSNER